MEWFEEGIETEGWVESEILSALAAGFGEMDKEGRAAIVRIGDSEGGISTGAHISCTRSGIFLLFTIPLDLKYLMALFRLLVLVAGLT